ncbi:syndecan-4 [Hemiscyllium ocellatum]|uniref:syndecan-4 n=1 Tax=Hemiscyllium ocellatum TaxID=170820 RepID=UPI0029673F31|nr:syndecan-4 [Hemiscyllium ocellatum]
MFGINSLAIFFLISLGGIFSANTQKLSERNHFDDLEGSGVPSLNKLHPHYEQEEGSGFSSGDYFDQDDGQERIDDEDDEMDNQIDEDVTYEVEDPIISNEVLRKNNAAPEEDIGNRVAMASANAGGSVFESTEMLAAMIAGGTIGLLFAILLILLLVYRMRKKDEGSYDLSKKPIYKKAPTTEFYA